MSTAPKVSSTTRRWIAAVLLAGLPLAVPAAPRVPERAELVAITEHFGKLPKAEFPALDVAKLGSEDAITDKLIGLPTRIAVGRDVSLDINNAGSWSQAANGDWIWRLGVAAKDAVHLNFGFSRFDLPVGAELLIVAMDGVSVLGPYTADDRLPHGQLWTPVLPGDRAVIQLTVPAALRNQVGLQLSRVAQGYRGFGRGGDGCKSGACNTDVACLASTDPWNDVRRSVGAYTKGGVDFCTGALINNTRNDRRMLFATASHCEVTSDSAAASVLVYWKYESPTCRTPGSTASGTPIPKPNTTTRGLRFVAATNEISSGTPLSSNSDWTLIELETPPAGNSFNLFWAGWDRTPPPTTCSAPSDRSSTSGLCASIHHPSVDEKRITFVEAAMTRSDYNIRGSIFATGVHWLANWDPSPPFLANISPTPSSLPPSVTEGGSSGSPLFNANRRIIGVLSGGLSECGAPLAELNDFYGGLFHSWDGLGSSTTRMKDHLDPTSSGVTTIAGIGAGSSISAQLNSAAFTSSPNAGSVVTLSAAASGGSGGYSYAWDTDGDGLFERSGSASSLSLSYPKAQTVTITLRVTDGAGATGTTSRALTVLGPRITAVASGAPTQLCGNGNASIDPGERWQLPVRLSNSGSASLGAAHSIFAVASSTVSLPLGPDQFGYRAGTSASGSCTQSWIDTAAAAPLTLAAVYNNAAAEDEGRAQVALQGDGFSLYGSRYNQMVVSTNGYLAMGTADTGGDYENSCAGSESGSGARLQVLHDDLGLTLLPGAGIRYSYFASCPRVGESDSSQGCHVITWSHVQPLGGSGDDEFQAVLYEDSGQIVYQYRQLLAGNAGSASIGIASDEDFTQALSVGCNSASAAASGSAVCFYAPDGLPESGESVLRLPAAVQASASIAAGAAATVNVPFNIDSSAACGSALGFEYVASTDNAVHSFNRGSVFSGTVGASCTAVSNCSDNGPALSPRRGLYFTGARPGNGMNGYFYDIGGRRQIFGGLWYTALANRSSAWYEVVGEVRDYAGEVPISEYRRSGSADPVATAVGRGWVAQTDNDSLMFAWQFDDGRSGAERMDTVSQGFPASASNHTQAWSNGGAGQKSWGIAIESLAIGSGFEFVTSYIYDGNGLPRWVAGDKSTVTSGTLNMLDYQAHCPGCPWFADYNNTAAAAGSINLQYSARNAATLSTSISLPAPLSGSWTRSNLPITPIQDPQP